MYFLHFLLIVLFSGWHVTEGRANSPSPSSLVINEFLSSNNENITDEDGDHEDWIEFYNTGEDTVRLNGYGLSDREGEPGDAFRWVFPDTTIRPGEYMIVWASGKDRRTPGKPLHTNFSIARDGEPLRLTHYDGTTLDRVPPVFVPTDYSYGRQPDGSGQWYYFSEPTPGASNTTHGVRHILEPPEFSHEGGFYDSPFYLSLSLPDHLNDVEEIDIYYTTDGSRPGPDNGKRYEDSIHIENRTDEPNDISMIPTNNYGPDHPYDEDWKEPLGQVFKGTVVRAVSVAPDAEPIEIATRSFFVEPGLENRYRLPVVSLATDRKHFFSQDDGIYVNDNFWETGEKWERPVHFEFFEKGGKPVLSQDAGVRIHGGTSRGRPVKSLRMYARRSYGQTWFEYPFIEEAPVDKYKRFLLRNSGNDWDGTYFRDALMQELIAHTGVETQYYRPAVVFINGEYWGIKNIRKRYDHRYFETMYDLDREDLVLLEGNAEVKEGYAADRLDFLDLRELLDKGEVAAGRTWRMVADRMDLENFRDYHIAQIYYRNTDWPANNIDYWRKRTDGPQDDALPGHDGRWRWLLYDTDFGFNLDFDYVRHDQEQDEEMYEHNTLRFAVEGSHDHWPNPQWSVMMLRGALRNSGFRDDFINRFAGLLNTAFSEDRVVTEIDKMYNVLKPHMEEHIRRWRGPSSMQEWEADVESMRDFARNRPEAIRSHITSHFNLSGTFNLNLDVDNPDAGHISVHSIDIKYGETGIPDEPWPWSGHYFRGVPVKITAHPADGYRFAGWEGRDEEDETLTITHFGNEVSLKAGFEQVDVSSATDMPDNDQPKQFEVKPARPNPFNNTTVVTVVLPERSHVGLTMYSIDGRKVQTVHDGELGRGYHELTVDATHWASGIYIGVAEAGSKRETFSVTLVK